MAPVEFELGILLLFEFETKKIHFGELSLKINSLLLFCYNSIVEDKLFIFKNLDISWSVISPSTQKIKRELDKIIKKINVY